MRTPEMDKVYPLPWKHVTHDGTKSSILAANGMLVAGSQVMPVRLPASAEFEAHALIVRMVNGGRGR